MRMFKPDEGDTLKVRRYLALFVCAWALLIWPNLLIAYHHMFGTPEGIVKAMLVYIGTLASGPIGAYLWATFTKDK